MRRGSGRQSWVAAIAAALAAARARDPQPGGFIGHIEVYCETTDCAVREIEMFFKEHQNALPPRLACPACRAPLTLHHVQTAAEYDEYFDRAARSSVNHQRWRRDHPHVLSMPLGEFLSEDLPPCGRCGFREGPS
jgi:hypothetical protein